MTIEEKAKRYDEALKEAVIAHKDEDRHLKATVERIFPELKESEDERKDEKIRKDILWCLKHSGIKESNPINPYVTTIMRDAIAWLEKQGESDETKAKMFLMNKGYPIDTNGTFPTYDEIYNIIRDGIEKQGEQKSADKVEPKFHEGDWIAHNVANFVFQIVGVGTYGYNVVNREGYAKTISLSNEENYHLWTIQDAKDGDVLVCNINKAEIGGDIEKLPNITPTICVYQNVVKDKDYIHTYCSLYNGSSLILSNSMYYNTFVYNIQPATKEQRNLLFQKMKEAGYMWDAEKKELNKTNEEFNGEDYGIDSLFHAKRILEKTLGKVDGYQSDDGILEHKCAIASVNKVYKQKPTWSEEDENMLKSIIATCELAEQDRDSSPARHLFEMQSNWLKSLKERYTWKPSNEQMKALNWALSLANNCGEECSFDLRTLYEQLKKLRE